MATKKKDDYKAGETIELNPEDLGLGSDKSEAELRVEIPKVVTYVAYAPFDFKGKFEFKSKHYEPGDKFTPPDNMTRDEGFDQFRAVAKRRGDGESLGLAFTELGDVISSDPKIKNDPNAERYTYRHILPVKEA